MEFFNFTPYEGEKKYIFISYAHANSILVTSIAEKLHDLGYNIWYDSGIEYGDKWIRSIENHLKNSEIVLSFISPEYSRSDWCMREYTYAEKIGKKVVHVKICDGVFEGGLAMMVSNRQIINDALFLTEKQIVNEIERVLERSKIFPDSVPDSRKEQLCEDIRDNKDARKVKSKSKGKKYNKASLIAVIIISAAVIVAVIILAAVLGGGSNEQTPGEYIPETAREYTSPPHGDYEISTETAQTEETAEKITEETTKAEITDFTEEYTETIAQKPTEDTTITETNQTVTEREESFAGDEENEQ